MATTDLLAGSDVAALVRIRRPEHALLASLRRPSPDHFVATLLATSEHPYLFVFGWRHPITVAEIMRQLAVAAVRTSLPVPERCDYALTRMRWRYPQALALGPAPGSVLRRVELQLGERSERDGMLAKLAASAQLFAADEGDEPACMVELGGGFYPFAVLDELMRKATGGAAGPVPDSPPPAPSLLASLAASMNLAPAHLLIAEPIVTASGRVCASVVATTAHPFFHHNLRLEQRRHVPVVLLLEAALQLAAVWVERFGDGGPRALVGVSVALSEYVALNRSDTWIETAAIEAAATEAAATEAAETTTLSIRVGQGAVDKGSFELALARASA